MDLQRTQLLKKNQMNIKQFQFKILVKKWSAARNDDIDPWKSKITSGGWGE